MKFAIISCLIISGIVKSSFVIEKTSLEARKSRVIPQESYNEEEDEDDVESSSPTQGQFHGISALSNPSFAAYKSLVQSESEDEVVSRKSRGNVRNQSVRRSHGSPASYGSSVNALTTGYRQSKAGHSGRKSSDSSRKSRKGIDSSRLSRRSNTNNKYKNARISSLKSGKSSKSRNSVISSQGRYSGPNSISFTIKSQQKHSKNQKSHKSRASKVAASTRGSKVIASTRGSKKSSSSRGSVKKSSKQQKTAVSTQISSKTKSTRNVTIDDFVYVTLPLNQWTEFYFSEVGQLPYSRWTFDIPANQKCSLQVVDSFCVGDRFQAIRRLDSGVEIPLLSTPVVPFNPVVAEQIRLGGNVNCTPFTTDAATAWASSSWSKGEVALSQPGNYKLILKSLLAPYGSGGAFLRVNCESTSAPVSTNLCSYGSSKIKYIRQTLTFTQQAAVCQLYGLRPLDVTQANIQEARSVLLNCAGVGTRAWISSYNGDNYRGFVGLSLHATQLSEVGAISATPDNSPLEGVLCQ